ncbi:hypothetical protein BN946_scf184834.g4 [Trametes cinnabarina]|uniref:Uncharacterized protein n=1 Tax=Pycnoporus cinnabarinus TaxID=5643 RepID=A0A060S3K0_PYCCI|nr:hypothetical protein BN946_scf184834.g4 [Trametes cinnabarina]
MPATPLSATQGSESSRTSASTLTRTAIEATHPVITTTITTGGTGTLPTIAAVSRSDQSNVPVAAIAGGTAAGVVLALIVVVGWAWWGKCIKRKKAKQIKEALAVLEVRENTRKNASSLSHPASQYRPAFSLRGQHDRKVTFISAAPSSDQSTLKGTMDSKSASAAAAEKNMSEKSAPRPPTPAAVKDSASAKVEKPEPPLPPPVPRRNPTRGRAPVESTMSAAPTSYAQHRLAHQPSTLSSGSVYSTQSAIEERQTSGVPSSLLLALGSEDIRRSLLANYLPWNRPRNSTASQNRLSEYSTGSFYSQFDDQPWEPVGYAIGDDEELMRQQHDV